MSTCPLCKQDCRRETLSDSVLCETGFAYVVTESGILVSETNRTSPPTIIVPISQRVTFRDGPRLKLAT